MWHASVKSAVILPRELLRKLAFKALEGVGDTSRGEWEEYEDFASLYHVRRRLSEAEQARVGDAVDIRGTPEQEKRWLAVRKHLPVGYRDFKD